LRTRIAINGFGRIGRITLKAMLKKDRQRFKIIAVNDLADTKTLAHLFKYDSIHGIFDGEVRAKDDMISIDGEQIRILSEKDPLNLPWENLGINVVIHANFTMILEENPVKILVWYDNEWGYSHRVADLMEYIANVKTRAPELAGTLH
jgi:glyceraldehyde-3-phosphate dehydrogenase/erythrose-4-phosphate dehydrogenase